jgi:hypothetical protein
MQEKWLKSYRFKILGGIEHRVRSQKSESRIELSKDSFQFDQFCD